MNTSREFGKSNGTIRLIQFLNEYCTSTLDFDYYPVFSFYQNIISSRWQPTCTSGDYITGLFCYKVHSQTTKHDMRAPSTFDCALWFYIIRGKLGEN